MNMWFKISFFIVLAISALCFGLLIYLAIEYPILLIAIIATIVICMRYQLKNAVVVSPDEEI